MEKGLEERYPKPIRTLVLSGGSIKGIAMLGAMQCLSDRGLLDGVQDFIGTSVGCILAYLYILGYSPVEIMVFLCQKGFVERVLQLDPARLVEGQKSIASYQGIQEFLEKRTVEKFQQYFTLQQLRDRTGKRLICSTFNVSRRCMEYISPDTHPDLPCITAVRMSSALPFLFEPFAYLNSVYIDGGIGDDFPLSQIDPSIGPAFGIRVITPLPTTNPLAMTILDYMNLLFLVFKSQIQDLTMKMFQDRCETIFSLPIPASMNMFSFSLSTTQKFDLFSVGYETTRSQLFMACRSLPVCPPMTDEGDLQKDERACA